MFGLALPLAAIDDTVAIAGFFLAAAIGGGAAWLYHRVRGKAEMAARREEADRIVAEANAKAAERLRQAEIEARRVADEAMTRFEQDTAETRNELKNVERRLEKREDALEKKLDVLVTKEKKIEAVEAQIADREKAVQQRQAEVDALLVQQRQELLRIARLTPDQAKQLCLRQIESEVEREAGELVERILTHADENAKERARYITISAIQRYAAEHTCESVVSTVDVPNDEMKGRIIGREGRNIRALEKATGVTVIVDDTPGIISISCFDPVRREIARASLDQLVHDGRIHPTRIEEIVAQVSKDVERKISEAGRDAAAAAKVNGVNKKILDVMGRLTFRTSYGQNVLKHSIEVAHLCGLMADELGLDGQMARRCGLLHDLGKALDHEFEGPHTRVGYEFARRYNEPPAVLNAIIGHHGDVEATHPYTPLVTAADAISAARPGGRRESVERYIKRLQELEAIATSFEGVNQAYAIEAGREVRVIVDANRVEDRSALKLARDVARKIEDEIPGFPGEIKVTVLRELRATEYAISGKARGMNGERAKPVEATVEDDEQV